MAQTPFDIYLEGWRLGDGEQSLSATAPTFFYHDPNTARIERNDFVAFVEDFKSHARTLTGGDLPSPFLDYSDIVISDGIAWCWWRVAGTELQGAALIYFNDEAVLSERIAYFSKLPE